ncbi:4201_t:CDS:2, partial [Entrophospora sp. SA101]
FVLLQEKENVNDVQTDHCFDNNFTSERGPSKNSHKRPLKSTSNDKATFADTPPLKKTFIELMSWKQAKEKLATLFTNEDERGKIKGLLLNKPLEERLEYFEGEDKEIVASLKMLLQDYALLNEDFLEQLSKKIAEKLCKQKQTTEYKPASAAVWSQFQDVINSVEIWNIAADINYPRNGDFINNHVNNIQAKLSNMTENFVEILGEVLVSICVSIHFIELLKSYPNFFWNDRKQSYKSKNYRLVEELDHFGIRVGYVLLSNGSIWYLFKGILTDNHSINYEYAGPYESGSVELIKGLICILENTNNTNTTEITSLELERISESNNDDNTFVNGNDDDIDNN